MEKFHYNLPKELIANAPANPRDSSRLFVYDTQTDRVTFDTFANIAKYIPKHSLLVLNDTKVVPARLTLMKKTGGKVTALFLMNEWDGSSAIKGLPDRGIKEGDQLFADGVAVIEMVSHVNKEFTFKLLMGADEFRALCYAKGSTPIPPYIHAEMGEQELREKYQTAFAAKPASVAAPTASLHFTDRVFKTLADKGVEQAKVTLHVGRGTFAPVGEQADHLHVEPIEVSAESAHAIARAKKERRCVITAGTTALRTVEAAASEILAGKETKGVTDIFIRAPYKFQIADGLITNFHLPGTSLLMLLDAFLRNKGARRTWHELYEIAIAEKFRFYSFGDAMLII